MNAINKIIPEGQPYDLHTFWTMPTEQVYAALHCGSGGLNAQDAELRLRNTDPTGTLRARTTACCGRCSAACSNPSP